MKPRRGGLLFFVTAGMELSWLYAWAAFLTTSIQNRPFPFPEAVGTFILGFALTRLSTGKGWRVVSLLALQISGLILAALRMVYVFNPGSYPFLSLAWLTEFFNAPRGPLEWLSLIYILIWALLFWMGGVTLARRSSIHSTLCSRFDIGLAAFFLLFLIQLLLWVKGEIRIDCPTSQLLVFPFFVFSLLAIGLVRTERTTPRNFLPGYQAIGVIIGFALFIFLFGTGLVLFFLPYLTMSAEVGYAALQTAAKPLGYIFVEIIRFLYMRNVSRPETSPPSPDPGMADLTAPTEKGWWAELLEKILGYALGGVIGLLVVIFAGAAVFYLFRWLLSKTPVAPKRQSLWRLIPSWFKRCRMFFSSCWQRIRQRMIGYPRAAQIYASLCHWGRYSGFPHLASETPREYGLRLRNRFPSLGREIQVIIEAFNHEVYGEITLPDQQMVSAQFAWRRLRSPAHWPSRLKAWLFRQEDNPL